MTRLMLPKLDGISLVQNLRRDKIRVPVIFLSAKGSVEDRVKGLQSGRDDYLTKPFSFAELLARVQALMRRAAPAAAEATRLTAGDLTMDHSVLTPVTYLIKNGHGIDITWSPSSPDGSGQAHGLSLLSLVLST
jgi:DNA-binding response OmpR family regulator